MRQNESVVIIIIVIIAIIMAPGGVLGFPTAHQHTETELAGL